MKRRLNFFKTLCAMVAISLLAQGTLNAQNKEIVNIPDPNFKAALLAHVPEIDTDGDNEISVAEAAALDGTLDLNQKNISDLTGLEAFVNIKKLKLYSNAITGSVDFSANTKLERISWVKIILVA